LDIYIRAPDNKSKQLKIKTMKRLEYKIGLLPSGRNKIKIHSEFIVTLSVLLLIGLSSCKKEPWYGHDGRPGDTYLSLTWQVAEPVYLDAGTGAIPPAFYWGQHYLIYPGYYHLYYEGSIWNGLYWASYAWNVDYEIRQIPGEKGDWYYNGADGPDHFFTIECNPYGPYFQDFYKSDQTDTRDAAEISDECIVVKQQSQGFEMKVTYTRVKVVTNR
jgi:hypothetical protein